MNVNSDFSLKAVIHTHAVSWEASPVPGISRKPLDRIGDEVARASTIVKYEANSAFTSHQHGAGEEILVLEGLKTQSGHGLEPRGMFRWCLFSEWGLVHLSHRVEVMLCCLAGGLRV